MKYQGVRDAEGVLVAAQAKFVPGISGKNKAVLASKDQETEDKIPPQSKWIDPNGKFHDSHAKVRLSDAGGWCGWHKVQLDQSLQDRVHRVGMNVIPSYQKQMAADEAAKVHFRFYAVDESQIRSELVCRSGLILVPKQVVDRIQSDDQLAAVLSDGVAFSLQLEGAKVAANKSVAIGGEVADFVLLGVDPLSFIIVNGVVAPIAMRPIVVRMEQQRGRMALTMLADAGYDPRQAPEAWRLPAPGKLPANPGSLKYPDRSKYQLEILRLQYGAPSAKAAQAEGTATKE